MLPQSPILPSLGKEVQIVKLPNMPKERYWLSATTHKGKVYMSGMHDDVAEGRTNHIVVYSTTELNWSMLPVQQMFPGVASINDHITLIGGGTDKITNMLSSWYDVEGQWRQVLPPMPTGRCFPAAYSHDGLLLVTGGAVEGGSTINTTDVLDLTTMVWTTPERLKLPVPLLAHHLVLCREYLYLVGGAATFRIESPEQYNSQAWKARWSDIKQQAAAPQHSQPNRNVWTRVADPPTLFPSAVSCGGTLYAVGGGTEDEEPDRGVYAYNIDRNQWVLVGDMSVGRYSHGTVALTSTTMFVAGGFVRDNGSFSPSPLAELILL